MILLLFKKKNKSKTGNSDIAFGFKFAMDYIETVLEYEKTLEDKINMIDFFMEVTRRDIQYDLLSKFLYSEMDDIKIDFPFAMDYFISNSDFPNKAVLIRKDKTVDLSQDTIILLPWDRYAFSYTVKSILQNGFKYIKSNHRGYYFSDIDLCYVYNGNHSIATGIIKKTGQIRVKEYDIKNLFKDLTTDGLNWYINGEKQLIKVFDFRISILYELAKTKYNLTNNSL
ncbi:hypothetical protein SAMN02745180_00570 [Sporanaerobacter acetigenes DSM 13106]|uniref:Uncharacterized protein n=1 Tax=Sporanaerobacter acetigenes DSM 13106 TaxID=1123281 RepID=A0A1M5U9E4_9FIRM|nr:hypothetical protein SAMN02745180_00570 [Sporanaerobacter acetigenes DSM 13106]